MRTYVWSLAMLVAAWSPASGAPGVKPSPPSRMALVQAQCAGHCACAVDADCGQEGTCTTGVCTAGDPARVGCNADAECAPAFGCTPAPGPCSQTARFAGGTLILRGLKQPAPTRDPSQNDAGEIRLSSVSVGAEPYTGTLAASVVYKTTFATDVNGNCALNAFQIAVEALTGRVDCKNGKCRGHLMQIAALPKQCADVAIVNELMSAVVRDPRGAPLATVGLLIPAGKADAP